MNILFVDKRFPNYGGVAVVTSMLSQQFVADGHSVYVATLLPKLYEGIEELTPKGVQVTELKTPTWNLSNISRLRKIIIDKKIDVIINQWALHPEVAFISNKARKGTKCKLICELHGAPNTTKMIIGQTEKMKRSSNLFSKLYNKIKLWGYHLITKASIKYVYRSCDHYVLLSEGYIPMLQKYANLKETSKLCAIGNAISISDIGFKFDVAKKKKQLLYVGRMDPLNKRVDRIIEVWKKIFKHYPDWTLELVGEGPQLPYLKDYISINNIDRVSFHEFQIEPPRQYYEDASILLLTSDLEGFGLVIVEAMQFGAVPVVYGSYVAVYDIITDGKDGFITPMPYNIDNTEKCIRQLMDDDKIREKMALAAIEKSRRFTLECIKQKWYAIMNDSICHN